MIIIEVKTMKNCCKDFGEHAMEITNFDIPKKLPLTQKREQIIL